MPVPFAPVSRPDESVPMKLPTIVLLPLRTSIPTPPFVSPLKRLTIRPRIVLPSEPVPSLSPATPSKPRPLPSISTTGLVAKPAWVVPSIVTRSVIVGSSPATAIV